MKFIYPCHGRVVLNPHSLSGWLLGFIIINLKLSLLNHIKLGDNRILSQMQIAKKINLLHPTLLRSKCHKLFTADPTHITPYSGVPKESNLPDRGRGARGSGA